MRNPILPMNVMASKVPSLLQDRRIDAFFFTVGHPSDIIQKALSGERNAQIIPITGKAIDALVDQIRQMHCLPRSFGGR